MTETKSENGNQISLSEIFAIIWAHKLLIAACILIAISFGSQRISQMERLYTAKVIFKLQDNSNNSSITAQSSELGALASIAGLSGLTSSTTDILLERMQNREFILNASQYLLLENDKFFNTYNQQPVDKTQSSKIKTLLGIKGDKRNRDHSLYVTNQIVNNFLSNVKAVKTEADAIKISFSHAEPQMAAIYANGVMEFVKELVTNEKVAASEEKLAYLSETLADALQDVASSGETLKNFLLNNNIRAEESFVFSSFSLDKLRMERAEVAEIFSVLKIIRIFVEKENLDASSYRKLRADYPLIDAIKFRQILGMSETISDWTWPSIGTIDAVLATLSNRLQRIDVQISEFEEEAEIYAKSSEELERLRRDSKIAEAAYTVLLEQIKAQTVLAGFTPDAFKIFEYATPPLYPSYPKTNVILAILFLLGLLFGIVLAFLNALRRDVFYSKSALINETQPSCSLNLKKLRKISRKPISEINERISNFKVPELDEATIILSKRDIIFVVNTGSRVSAIGMSNILATHSALTGKNVALIDMTQKQKDNNNENQDDKNFNLSFGASEFGVSTLNLSDNINKTSFFTSKDLVKKLTESLLKFDQIFICTHDKEIFLNLSAVEPLAHSLVILSRINKTHKKYIRRLKQKSSVEILFHE